MTLSAIQCIVGALLVFLHVAGGNHEELMPFYRPTLSPHPDRVPSKTRAAAIRLPALGVDATESASSDSTSSTSSRPESDENWELYIHHILHFRQNHGHLLVPRTYRTADNRRLGQWVMAQRSLFKAGKLRETRTKQLRALEFSWNRQEHEWEERCKELERYWRACEAANRRIFRHPPDDKHVVRAYGTPYLPEATGRLGRWLDAQRFAWKKGKLAAHRVHRFRAMGLTPDAQEGEWDVKFQELMLFQQQLGHCTVPYPTTDGKIFKRKFAAEEEGRVRLARAAAVHSPVTTSLGYWVTRQKALHKRGRLRPDRFFRLRLLGCVS